MSFLKPVLIGVLRDKTANNLVVALLVAFSLANLVEFMSETIGAPGWNAWWSITWHQLLGFAISLVLAELISRIPKR